MIARLLPAALVGVAITLVGCGTTHAGSSPAVASVNGISISSKALAHWMSIKRIELEGAATAGAPPEAEIRSKALAFLITSQWLQQEAADQGADVAPAQAEAFYEHLRSSPSGAEFAASLKRRGLSRADEVLVLHIGELAEKLRTRIAVPLHGAPAAAVKRRVDAFLASYRERWKQRTACEPGYVVAECRNGPPLAPASGPARG